MEGGLCAIGKQGLQTDVQDLLAELAYMRDLLGHERVDTLKNMLLELKEQLEKLHVRS